VGAVAIRVNVVLNILLNRHSLLLVSIRTGHLLDVMYTSYRCSQADHVRGMESRAHPVKQISCRNYSVAQSVLFPRCVHRLQQRGAAVMATHHRHATQIIIGLNTQVARYARSPAGSTLLCNNKSNTWRHLHYLLENVCASDV
jgi:hypothetical protein